MIINEDLYKGRDRNPEGGLHPMRRHADAASPHVRPIGEARSFPGDDPHNVDLHQELGLGQPNFHEGTGWRVFDKPGSVFLLVLQLGPAHLGIVGDILEEHHRLDDVVPAAAYFLHGPTYLVQCDDHLLFKDIGVHDDGLVVLTLAAGDEDQIAGYD